MKSLIIFVSAVCCAYAAVSSPDPVASVVRSAYQASPEGNYQFSYETDNGILWNVEGKFKAVGKDEVAHEVSGVNQFVSPEGQTFEVKYVANEFGYQPEGAHLPTPPAPEPIPDYILRAIEWTKQHPYVTDKKV